MAGQRGRQSRLENRFNFSDTGFNMYISARDLTPAAMLRRYKLMAASEHPLVRYAAGWAAAEYARNSHMANRSLSLEKRLGALQMARECWLSADFAAFQAAQTREQTVLEAKSFEIRRLLALANVPVMEVAASWFAGEPMDQPAVADRLRAAYVPTLSLGRAVNSLPIKTDEERKQRAGLAAEVACQLVGQSRTGEDYILMPASLRQDNNPIRELRADAVAVMNNPPHRMKLLQVRGGEKGETPPSVMDVRAYNDLVAPATRTVYGTITALALQDNHQVMDRVGIALNDMRDGLATRINEFPRSFSVV